MSHCYFSQAHPWFEGIEWDTLYQIKAAFIPEVNDELDTQNFEKFEEVFFSVPSILTFAELVIYSLSQFFLLFLQSDNQIPITTKSGPWRKVCT